MAQASRQMATSSQSSISQIHIYGCKWAWCRSVFEDHSSLVHHVVHDHARRSTPVRRRDLSMIRRAEEGSGESLKISYLMSGAESSIRASQKLASQSSQIIPPTSSLPSPPNSSPVNFASLSPIERLSDSMEVCSSSPDRPGDGTYASAQSAAPDILLHSHTQAVESTPKFASLSSAANSPAPLAVPNSPTFSSLVRSKKRKLIFEPLSQSSTDSHMSVEMQLTQSLEDNGSDQDAVGEDESEIPDFQVPEGSPAAPSLLPLTQEDSLYKSELPWDASRPESLQEGGPQPESRPSESLENDSDSWSQTPSQFKSFPIHYHGPHGSSPAIPNPISPEFDSSAPLQLSPPGSLASPTFAIGTPQRQNWYQPAVLRKRSKKLDPEEGLLKPPLSTQKSDGSTCQSSDRRSCTPRSKPANKSKKFRSGTLQIVPVPSLSEPMPEQSQTFELPPDHGQTMSQDKVGLADENNSLQSYMDLGSQSTQDCSFPLLQTQAPYQSQPFSQI